MNRLVARLVIWSQAFSLRFKIMGLAVGMVLLMGVSGAWLAQRGFLESTGAELERRGGSIAADLAARGADMLLTHNQLGLYELLRDTMVNNEDVRYVILLDARGRVAAHTFDAGFPLDLLGLPLPARDQPVRVELLRTEEGLLHDVAMPILGGSAGTVRVGMSPQRLRREAMQLTYSLAATVLAIAVVALVAAFMLTDFLTRPIVGLVDVARSAARGRLDLRAPPGPPDEIGLLAAAFNQMLAQLEESRRVKDELLTRVISAQEDERRRIARELHDETGQAITSLIVGLRALEEAHPQVQEASAGLRRLATGTLDEIRHLIFDLRPRALDVLGLVPALRQYCADFSRQHGIAVEFQAVGPDMRLPVAVETGLYRIVQEALTNISRHAGAAHASVVLDVRPQRVSAIVEDDGCGFEPRAAPGVRSLGIAGMRERAAALGGTLDIESGPGSGTTVFAKIPLAERDDADAGAGPDCRRPHGPAQRAETVAADPTRPAGGG